MNPALLTGLLVAFALGAGIVAILRTFSITITRYNNLTHDDTFSWKDYPLQRLLDQADADYLKRMGVSESRISELRAQRRKIYRLCLLSLSSDFHNLHRMLKVLIVHSQENRPDLTVLLAKQKIAFCRNMLKAEFFLFLHACGMNKVPRVDLLQPLRIIGTELQALTEPRLAAAGVQV